MFIIGVKFLRLEFDWVMSLFFSFFNFELFLSWRWSSGFRSHFTFFLFIFFLLLFNFLFLWNFSFFSPLFNQSAIFKGDQTIFSEFNFEGDSKDLMLRILSRSFVISDVFIETNNVGLIFDKNFDRFSSFELYGFAGRNFGSKIINHFSLSFRILSWIKAKVVIILNEVPIKLDSIKNSFVQSILLNSEERTLDSSL